MSIEPNTDRRRYRRLRRALVAALLGSSAALVVVLIGLMWFARASLPVLTSETLAAAEQRWSQRGVGDYDLSVRIVGRRAGEVQISVRDGEPIQMTRDGVTPKQRRTWDAWTVASLFDTLHTELEAARDPAVGYGAPAGATVSLRARFDPTYGYPAQFERSVLGTDLEMGWEIVQFTEAPSGQAAL